MMSVISRILSRLVDRPDLQALLARLVTSRLRAQAAGEVEFQFDGLTLRGDSNDLYVAGLAQGAFAELTDWSTLMAMIPDGGVVVDVGANIGIYALSAASRAGAHGRVFAFEPSRQVGALLEANAERNALAARLRVTHAAAGDVNGEVQFHIARDAAFSGIQDNRRSDIVEQITVPVVRLDDWWEDAGQPVDVMKIDVEGGEAAVLRGARNLVTGSPDLVLMLEHSPKNLTEEGAEHFERELATLMEAGFVAIFAEHDRVVRVAAGDQWPREFNGNVFMARAPVLGRLADTLAVQVRAAADEISTAHVEAAAWLLEALRESQAEVDRLVAFEREREEFRLRDELRAQALTDLTQRLGELDGSRASYMSLSQDLAELVTKTRAEKALFEQTLEQAGARYAELESGKMELERLAAQLTAELEGRRASDERLRDWMTDRLTSVGEQKQAFETMAERLTAEVATLQSQKQAFEKMAKGLAAALSSAEERVTAYKTLAQRLTEELKAAQSAED